MSHAPEIATPDHLFDLAQAALHEGRPETTVDLCRQLLRTQPDHAGAMLLQAEAHRDLNEEVAAELCYRRLLAHQPDLAEAWSGMAGVMFDQGRVDEAASCFSRALRVSADLPEAYYGRALIRERRGDHVGAHRDYLRAWSLSPGHPVPAELTDHDVLVLLAEAMTDAEEDVRGWLSTAAIQVMDVPSVEVCAAYDPFAPPAELLGHVPLDGARSLVPALLLFRRNLARYATDQTGLLASLKEGISVQIDAWMMGAGVDE